MVSLLVALALPWLHPLAFHPLRGWQTGAGGNTYSLYVGAPGHRRTGAEESAAWIARNVRYRDAATADPPNATLAHLPPNGVIVWAVIFNPAQNGAKPIQLDLSKARRLECCEAESVRGGQYELKGVGPGRTYSTIVRVYFGSRPTTTLRAQAQIALDHLELPPPLR